jgi:acyl dehydratase
MTTPTPTFRAPIDDRYFEDYEPGAVFEFGPTSLTEEEIIAFARVYDPQSIHIDPAKAAQGPFQGIIASGWQTVGMLMRLYVDHYLSHVASRASPGCDEVRWTIPVRPGDAIRLRVTILEAKASKSKPDRGTVITRMEGVNQNGEVVCSLKAVNLLTKRDANPA